MVRLYTRLFLRYLAPALMLTVALQSSAGDAASNKELQRLKGTVGYQASDTGQFNQVGGKYVLPDDNFAVTQNQSAALLQLPDSSIVALGQDTKVQVGAFNQTATGPGSTITVAGGTLRFDIKRPQGGTANYRFVTPTSTVGVRGTVGLLALAANGQMTVACLACAADSVTISAGGQTFALATGQAITVSATGAVTSSAVTSATLSGFSSAGVSTSASSGLSAATAGVAGSAASSAGAAAAAGGAAAAAGAGAAAVTTAQSKPSAAPAPSAAPNPNATQSGTITIQQGPVGPSRRPF